MEILRKNVFQKNFGSLGKTQKFEKENLELWKKDLETWGENLEIRKKIGNLERIWKFVKDLEIWKKIKSWKKIGN